MPIYDVSLPISESLIVWPGDPAVRLRRTSDVAKGDLATVTQLELGAHTGTHVDAPAHFVPGGAGVDSLDLSLLVGEARVVYVPEARAITAEVLEALEIPRGTRRVLFRTRNSDRWTRSEQYEFDEDFVAVTADGARWLVAHGVKLVGVDYLSVAPFDDPVPTHETLLRAGAVAVEGLDLSQIAPGVYRFVCLPLRIVDGDGSPARAILIDE